MRVLVVCTVIAVVLNNIKCTPAPEKGYLEELLAGARAEDALYGNQAAESIQQSEFEPATRFLGGRRLFKRFKGALSNLLGGGRSSYNQYPSFSDPGQYPTAPQTYNPFEAETAYGYQQPSTLYGHPQGLNSLGAAPLYSPIQPLNSFGAYAQPLSEAYGAPQPLSSYGVNQMPSLFGAAQPASFGVAQPLTNSFGATQAFGAVQPLSSFGAVQPLTNSFGATPALNSLGVAQPRYLFGASPQLTSYGTAQQLGSSFGAAPQPAAFGVAQPVASFGATQPLSSYGTAQSLTGLNAAQSQGSPYAGAAQQLTNQAFGAAQPVSYSPATGSLRNQPMGYAVNPSAQALESSAFGANQLSNPAYENSLNQNSYGDAQSAGYNLQGGAPRASESSSLNAAGSTYSDANKQ